MKENMASSKAGDDANETDCPKSREEAMAFFLSRSQNNSAAELRPPQQHRRNNRQSRISQHIQLFESKGPATSERPDSRMTVSLMATDNQLPEMLPPEPVYVNVTNLNVPAKPTLDLPTTKKKPLPNPRRSLFQPLVENECAQENFSADSTLCSPRRLAPPSSSRPEFVIPEKALPVETLLSSPKPAPHTERQRKTICDFGFSQLCTPPPLPETGPPIRKAPCVTPGGDSSRPETPSPHQKVRSRKEVGENAGDSSSVAAGSPVRNLDFLRHLTDLTEVNNSRKCMTLPNHIQRPVFGGKSPSPCLPSPQKIHPSEEGLHPSRRPLPQPPLQMEDDYSDTSGEPIYQELSEVSSQVRAAPLIRQPAVKKSRRSPKHFRSLRGLPGEFFEEPLPKPRASSFTSADLAAVGIPPAIPGRSRNPLHPHSSSCSSMSLTESDSGVSLELESMRDDTSIAGIRSGSAWSPSEFQKAVEKMRGFQCRSESLKNNEARVKNTPRMVHDKTRRHTLPISMLSATVLDDEEDDSGQSSTDKIVAELTKNYPPRGLWYQQPAVAGSAILHHLSEDQRKIQEATFEIICSEATHLRSLTVLLSVFKKAPEFRASPANLNLNPAEISLAVVSQQEERNLFLNIADVRNASFSLLKQLHERYSRHQTETGHPTMPDFSDILENFAVNLSKVYVKYCSDQLFQEKTLNGLKERKRFQEVVRRLESQKVCEQLDFRSYLMLPMQRITRLPLLISAVVKRCDADSPEHTGYKNALLAINKVVRECDEGAKRCACIEELCRIDGVLHWLDTSLKKIPIISAARSLVKRGTVDVIQIEHKFLPRRTFHKKSLHLLVFNDLFMLTKPKSGSEEALVVVDYCQRNLLDCLQVTPTERDDLLAHTSISTVFTRAENFRGLKLVLLRNNAQKTVEFFVIMPLESDYMRWTSVLNPSEKVEGDEKIYEIWDCPQYEVVADYAATENDELNVSIGDVVDVYRKSSDGWIEGRRMSDGHRGWLPISVANEKMTEHARARHLKERNRLLAASAQLMKERTSNKSTS